MKYPWVKWFAGDWRKDTKLQAASVTARGIWNEALQCMIEADSGGELTNTVPGWCRLLGCTQDEFAAFARENEVLGFCGIELDGVTLEALHVTLCNGNVTLVSRRLKREAKRRNSTAERVQKHRSRKQQRGSNAACNAAETGYTSEVRSQKSEIKCLNNSGMSRGEPGEPVGFPEFWNAYPFRPGNPRDTAAAEFEALVLDGDASPQELIRAAENYAKDRADEDPKFTYQCTTFLAKGHWQDYLQARPANGPGSGNGAPKRNPNGNPRASFPPDGLRKWLQGEAYGKPDAVDQIRDKWAELYPECPVFPENHRDEAIRRMGLEPAEFVST